MRIAICDDCREDALALKRLLGGREAAVYADAESLLSDVEGKQVQYDLFLLDIFLEGSMSGLELAERLNGAQGEAVICFVSTSRDFYREAYDLYAIQYLIKPVQRADVEKLLSRVEKNLEAGRQQKLSFQSRGQIRSIPYEKILHISSRNHIFSVRCTDGTELEGKGKLSDLEAQICGDIFMRCHQSFIVNMYQVEGLFGTDLAIGGERIPISRRYLTQVKRRYQEILFEEVD